MTDRQALTLDSIGAQLPIRNVLQLFEPALRGFDSFGSGLRLVYIDHTLQALERMSGAVDQMLEESHLVAWHDRFLLCRAVSRLVRS
jgi:hypothetical protein